MVDIDFYKILSDKKSYGNILTYDISWKTFIGSKSLRVRLDKRNIFIKIYDGTRYLALFGTKKYDENYDWIKYIISEV